MSKSSILVRVNFCLFVLAVCILLGLSICGDRGFITPSAQLLGATLNSQSAEQEPRFSYDGRYLVFLLSVWPIEASFFTISSNAQVFPV